MQDAGVFPLHNQGLSVSGSGRKDLNGKVMELEGETNVAIEWIPRG